LPIVVYEGETRLVILKKRTLFEGTEEDIWVEERENVRRMEDEEELREMYLRIGRGNHN
jgi:hypothetical protein